MSFTSFEHVLAKLDFKTEIILICNRMHWIPYLTILFYFGPAGRHLHLSPQNPLVGRHVVGFLDFFMDVFLEVQNNGHSQILHLIDYIA